MVGCWGACTMEEEEALPEGWSKHYSNTWKKHYYHNKKTGKQMWEHPGNAAPDSPAQTGGGGTDTSRKRGASEDAGAGEGVDNGHAAKRPKPSTVDFSMVKEASAAKAAAIAANMPPMAKTEDTPEIAVLRDKEVKKLIQHIRNTCSRSGSLSKEPGNALTRFFFLSQIDSRRQRKDSNLPHDPLMPYDAGKDSCLHRELLKAGLEPGESDKICLDLARAASEAVQVVHDARAESRKTPASFVDEVVQKEAQNRQMLICWKDEVMTINREHFLKVRVPVFNFPNISQEDCHFCRHRRYKVGSNSCANP